MGECLLLQTHITTAANKKLMCRVVVAANSTLQDPAPALTGAATAVYFVTPTPAL